MVKLRNRATGQLVNPNDVLTTFRGERVTITGWATDGHNRVYVRDEQGRTAEYFPTVVDCELVND